MEYPKFDDHFGSLILGFVNSTQVQTIPELTVRPVVVSIFAWREFPEIYGHFSESDSSTQFWILGCQLSRNHLCFFLLGGLIFLSGVSADLGKKTAHPNSNCASVCDQKLVSLQKAMSYRPWYKS